MKVLLASRRPAYPFFQGGAERSFYELARALAARGHRVMMLGECGPLLRDLDAFFVGSEVVEKRWEIDESTVQGQRVSRRQVLVCQLPGDFEVVHTFGADFRATAEGIVQGFAPDVIATQLEGASEISEFCRFGGARILHFIRDTSHPFNYHALAPVPGASPRPICVANSHFTADFVSRELQINAHVLYPIVRLPAAPAEAPGPGRKVSTESMEAGAISRRSMLLVNPIPTKGGEMLYRAALELQDLSFRVLPGWAFEVGGNWRALPNVEAWDWPVLDMVSAYKSVDLVVLPSQSSEGFGRVAVEAQLAGVPVLASRHSGLAEILEGSAPLVEDYESSAAWVRAIRSVLSSPVGLAKWRSAGLENARRFAPDRIAGEFEELVEGLGESEICPRS